MLPQASVVSVCTIPVHPFPNRLHVRSCSGHHPCAYKPCWLHVAALAPWTAAMLLATISFPRASAPGCRSRWPSWPSHIDFSPSWFLPTISFLLIRVLDHAMHVIPWFPPLLTDTCPLSRPFDVISTVRSLLNMHGSRKKKHACYVPQSLLIPKLLVGTILCEPYELVEFNAKSRGGKSLNLLIEMHDAIS